MGITDRLIAAKKGAGFSTADMSVWCDDAGQSTMRTWLNGTEPAEHRVPQLEANVDLLERAIKEGIKLPVPLHVTQFARKDYIRDVKNDLTSRISKPRSANGRSKVLGSDTQNGRQA